MSEVVVQGEGVAAHCCATLLDRGRIAVALQPSRRAGVPALMISASTQHLIADVMDRRDLFRNLPRIEKRIVLWGRDANPATLPHSAVVISENELADRMRPVFQHSKAGSGAPWTVLASRPFPPGSIEHHFGSRTATTSAVKLQDHCDEAACWTESLQEGWLFLLPAATRSGWLISVGGPPEQLLRQSRLIAMQVLTPLQASAGFPAYPRIVDPICGSGWLACGSAAMAFDPLCGDGSGYAAREAILVAAVIRAARAGGDTHSLLAHYRKRLIAGFLRHLEVCREFYSSGYGGSWWDAELAYLSKGIAWCQQQLSADPEFHYKLNGFELEPVARTSNPAKY